MPRIRKRTIALFAFIATIILIVNAGASSYTVKSNYVTLSLNFTYSSTVKSNYVSVTLTNSKVNGVKSNYVTLALSTAKKIAEKSNYVTLALSTAKKIAEKSNYVSLVLSTAKKIGDKSNYITLALNTSKKLIDKSNYVSLVLKFLPELKLDMDKDGFFTPQDCDDYNPARNPGNNELCNNLIDDDCDGKIDKQDNDCESTPPTAAINYPSSEAVKTANFTMIYSVIDNKDLECGAKGMVAYWSLDNQTNSITKDYTNNLVGTVKNAVWNSSGISGGAYYYNEVGNDDYLSIGKLQSSWTDISVCGWQYPQTSGWMTGAIFSQGVDDGPAIILYAYNNGFGIRGNPSNPEVLATPNMEIPYNSWTFMCGTWNETSSNASLYVNGNLKSSASNPSVKLSGKTFNNFGSIGSYCTVETCPAQMQASYKGLIDEVIVYNRTLNSSEIKALYSKGLEGVSSCLAKCKISVRNGTNAQWKDYGMVLCGTNRQFNVSCNVEGKDACGIRIYSNDTSGNDVLFENNYTMDFSAPLTAVKQSGGTLIASSEEINLTCNDAITSCNTTYYKIVDEGESCGTTGFKKGLNDTLTCPPNSLCSKKICFFSNDSVGNTESVKTSGIFTLDTKDRIAPVTEITPYNQTWKSTFTFNLTCRDSLSGCRWINYSIIDSESSCSSASNWIALSTMVGNEITKTIEVSELGQYKKKVCFKSIDVEGNAEAVNVSGIFEVTSEKPALNFIANEYDFEWTTESEISYNVSCASLLGCAKVDYSYYNYNHSSGVYNYNLKKFIYAGTSEGNFTADVLCSSGNVCKTNLSISATDNGGKTNSLISREFKIDLEEPEFESSKCTYKSSFLGISTSKACSPYEKIPSGREITLEAMANDGIGSGTKSVYISVDNMTSEKPLLVSIMSYANGRKKGTSTALLSTGDYTYQITVEDELGNNDSVSGAFSIGGDKSKNCTSLNGTMCEFYQACSGDDVDSKESDWQKGMICCLAKCLNRSNLATCKQQNGEIYDYGLRRCNGTLTPASDTIDRNKCCKGEVYSLSDSLAWYDLSGNRLSGAAKGDKVKCIGLSDTANPLAKYDMLIKVGSKTLFSENVSVNYSKKAESKVLTLGETGTYRCEAILYASPPKKIVANLEIAEPEPSPIMKFSRFLLYTYPIFGMTVREIELINMIFSSE